MAKKYEIITALITPFKENGQLDKNALEKIIRMNLEQGVDGFFVGGSAGEGLLLSLTERKELLESVIPLVKDKGRVIAHVGCVNTEQAIELGKHARDNGVDTISSLSPFYFKYSLSEVENYFFEIIDSVHLPMIIYNFPEVTGVTLTNSNGRRLFNHPKVIGIKHTSLDIFQLERMKSGFKDLVIYNGYENVYLGSLAMGADGVIGSTLNFLAGKFVKINDFFQKGQWEEALRVQKEANEIIEVLFEVGLIAGIKYALKVIGIECGKPRKPLKSLTRAEKKLIEDVIKLYY